MLRRRSLLVACLVAAAAAIVPATAIAGTFSISGTTIRYDGEPGNEGIAGFRVGSNIRFTRFGDVSIGPGPGCSLIDGGNVDCPLGGVTAVVLDLGAGNDVASIASDIDVPAVFLGGDGNDGLFGGGGVDSFFGGAGDDNIVSRDGRAESQVDCGDGHDTAISDDSDARTSCEEIEGDADRDGVRRPADCNDTNPAIHPGAVDIPDNGVDENCSGADATNLDRDRDGSPRPQDCDDSNPAVHPGASEVRGNDLDENCDGRVVPFAPIPGAVANLWSRAGSGTRNVRLLARQFPKGTSIGVGCSGRGCPKQVRRRRTVRSRTKPVSLHSYLGSRVLRKGARVTLRFTLAGHVGRVLRFRIGTPGIPDVRASSSAQGTTATTPRAPSTTGWSTSGPPWWRAARASRTLSTPSTSPAPAACRSPSAAAGTAWPERACATTASWSTCPG